MVLFQDVLKIVFKSETNELFHVLLYAKGSPN